MTLLIVFYPGSADGHLYVDFEVSWPQNIVVTVPAIRLGDYNYRRDLPRFTTRVNGSVSLNVLTSPLAALQL